MRRSATASTARARSPTSSGRSLRMRERKSPSATSRARATSEASDPKNRCSTHRAAMALTNNAPAVAKAPIAK